MQKAWHKLFLKLIWTREILFPSINLFPTPLYIFTATQVFPLFFVQIITPLRQTDRHTHMDTHLHMHTLTFENHQHNQVTYIEAFLLVKEIHGKFLFKNLLGPCYILSQPALLKLVKDKKKKKKTNH